jgi:site-specific DNA recombinase
MSRRIGHRGNKQRSQRVRSELEPRRVGGGYLLSGLVACGHVDGEEHPMNVESISAAAGKRGRYAFYICTRMKNSRGDQCQARRISVRGLDQAVINNLLEQVLTVQNLRPLAQELVDALKERSGDAGTRIMALETRLTEIERSMAHILDAFENMGYARQLQLRYDERLREQQETLVALDQLRRIHASSQQIRLITEKTLEDWVAYLRAALEGQDKEVARGVIRHFVARIVVKAGTGTIYYSFPFPDAAYMPSLGDLDPRGFEPLTSTVRL